MGPGCLWFYCWPDSRWWAPPLSQGAVVLGYVFLLILGLQSNMFLYFIFIGIELLYWVVSFCCPTSWILCVFISPLPLEPSTPRVSPVRVLTAPSPVPRRSFPPASRCPRGEVYMSVLVSQFIPFSFHACVPASCLSVCVSIRALQVGAPVPFF